MRIFCKSCPSGQHTDDCPRNLTEANWHYDRGMRDARAWLEPNSRNLAYLAGYYQGELWNEADDIDAAIEAELRYEAYDD